MNKFVSKIVSFVAALSMIAPVGFAPTTALAATLGPNNGDVFANDSTVGTISWSNPGNAEISGDIRAIADLDDNEVSRYLKATDFDFAIPAGATIDGIKVEVEKSAQNTNRIKDSSVRIVKGGVIGATNKADLANFWGTSDAYTTYGSPTDTWGLAWTPADINASDFGVAFAAKKDTTSGNEYEARVDHIRITVYYTPAIVPTTATLTLLKTVINDNGGGAVDTDWTLTATGPTNISGIEGNASVTNAVVNAGAYTLGENGGPTGYSAGTYSCVKNGGGAVVSNSITLAGGDTATCTVTNNDNAIVGDYTISGSSSVLGTVVTLSGTATGDNYTGQKEDQYIAVDWTGACSNASKTEFDFDSITFIGGSGPHQNNGSFIDATWSTSHDFGAPGTYPVCVKVYHANFNGAEGSDAATFSATIIIEENDIDDDGVVDDEDNCVNTPNADQADFDDDGFGNVCDSDDDNDEIADEEDPCPLDFENTCDDVETGSIKITKYDCPIGTEVNRTDNGTTGSAPEACVLNEDGVTFSYVYNAGQSDTSGPYPELALAASGSETGIGETNGIGELIFNSLSAIGRYLVYESDADGVQLPESAILGLYCEGDGDTDPNNNDNQELTFVEEDETAICVAYNEAEIVYQCSDGENNDGDDFTDYNVEGGDPECSSPTDNNEGPDMCPDVDGDQATNELCSGGGEDDDASIIWLYKESLGNGGTFPFTVSGEGSVDESDESFDIVTEGDGDSNYHKIYVYPNDYNSEFTITENVPLGWDVTAISCDELTEGEDYEVNESALTLLVDPNSSITCRYTNTAVAGALTVIKHVINDDGETMTANQFNIEVANEGDLFPVVGSESGNSLELTPGTYQVVESENPSYEATYSDECSGSIALGEHKTCTITNDDIEREDGTTSGSEADGGDDEGSVLGASVDTEGSVLGALSCSFLTYEQLISIKNGVGADPEIVKALQEWLNNTMDAGLTVNGVYDEATRFAVMLLQEKYADETLAPWGSIKATGNVWLTTSRLILRLVCGENVPLPELVPFNS